MVILGRVTKYIRTNTATNVTVNLLTGNIANIIFPTLGVSGQLARKEPMTTPETSAGQAVRSTHMLAVGDTLLGAFGSSVLLGEVIAVDDRHTAIKWGRLEIVTIDTAEDLAHRRVMRFRPAPSWWRRLFTANTALTGWKPDDN